MIYLNGNLFEFPTFPDGTTAFKVDVSSEDYHVITWKYDGDHECMLVYFLVNHIRSARGDAKICLELPYIPNARMDRVKSDNDVFTLKWFAKFINDLNFTHVDVLDPHSNVATALIDRVNVESPKYYIQSAISRIDGGDGYLLCFPDEGAAKRYSDLLKKPYVFGIKHRDWNSGKIESLELTRPEMVNGQNVLIVDDICSRGGTFAAMAKALRKAGAQDICLYVSHCENNIFNGTILTDGLISHVYTTGSIYRGDNPCITVIE